MPEGVISEGNRGAVVTGDSDAVAAAYKHQRKCMEVLEGGNYRIPVSCSFAKSSCKE
jgi:hypothetical protein